MTRIEFVVIHMNDQVDHLNRLLDTDWKSSVHLLRLLGDPMWVVLPKSMPGRYLQWKLLEKLPVQRWLG